MCWALGHVRLCSHRGFDRYLVPEEKVICRWHHDLRLCFWSSHIADCIQRTSAEDGISVDDSDHGVRCSWLFLDRISLGLLEDAQIKGEDS